jgi:hypothetical protein
MHNTTHSTTLIVIEDLESSELQEVTFFEAEKILGSGPFYKMGHAVGQFIYDLRAEDFSDLGTLVPY